MPWVKSARHCWERTSGSGLPGHLVRRSATWLRRCWAKILMPSRGRPPPSTPAGHSSEGDCGTHRRGSRGLCLMGQCVAELTEAERVKVECRCVELAEIEVGPACSADVFAAFRPRPLTDLVGQCLGGTTEITGELESG